MVKNYKITDYPQPFECENGQFFTIIFSEHFFPGDVVTISFCVDKPGYYVLSKRENE